MTDATPPAAVSPARWDGRRVLFDIQDADRSVACSISLTALQDVSEQRRFKPADLLQCFAAARPRIEAIARHKLRARPGSAGSLLNIWSDDITDAAQAAAPDQDAAHSV